MPSVLSVRAYSRVKQGHSHHFHQLVLPLRGSINLALKHFEGRVVAGECIVIQAGAHHSFTADSEAKFIVADLNDLPINLDQAQSFIFRINEPLSAFLDFVELQLKYQVNQSLEKKIVDTFYGLLAEQTLTKQYDWRIKNVVDLISDNLAHPYTIAELANIACLSPTQFKKLFKAQTGQTTMQFLGTLRMTKAQALLKHTDLPVSLVAEAVGYENSAAFSRRFSAFFGMAPSSLSR